MYAIGQIAQITWELWQNNFNILGISKCQWTASGYMKMSTGETILYSDRDANKDIWYGDHDG